MKKLQHRLKKYTTLENFLIFGILLLAAFMRLYRIGDYLTFLGDEGRDALEVLKILHGHLVFLGPRSSAADFYYGPIYFYMITPFLWLFHYDPVGPAVFVALVGIATVFLIYFVSKEFFGEKGGLMAAALYAVSPLVIAYSRSSWNPNPLPFVSLFLLYMLYKAIQKRSWKLFLAVGLLYGIAIQLQYIVVFLAIIIAVFTLTGYLLEYKKIDIKKLTSYYGLMLGGFLVGWSPFLAFEIYHHFPNLRTIIKFIFHPTVKKIIADNTTFVGRVYDVFFRLFGRLITRFPPPEQVNLHDHLNLQLWQLCTLLLAFASIFFLFKIKNNLAKLLLAIWFFLGVFLFGFYRDVVYDYYLGFLFPVPFILLGTAFQNLWDNKKLQFGFHAGKLISVILFLGLFIFNLYGNPFQYPPNRQKDQVKQIAEFVLSKTDGKPYNFALIAKGNSDHGYRYFFAIENRDPVMIIPPAQDPQRKSVTDQLLVVCEDLPCHPEGNSLFEIAGFGQAQIVGEWDVSVVKVYKLKHYTKPNGT